MTKHEKIELITLVIMLGFFTAVLVNFGQLIAYKSPHVTWFLFTGGEFGDFTTVYNSTLSLDPYVGDPSGGVYFPFSYLLLLPFTLFHVKTATILYLSLFFLGFGWLNWVFFIKQTRKEKHDAYKSVFFERTTQLRYFITLTFVTYPFLWVFASGNVESFLFLFLGAFVYLYHNKKYQLSAVFLGFAIGMKLYPFVFLLTYLSEKKFKPLFIAIITTTVVSIIPLLIFKSNISTSLHGFASDLHWANEYFPKSIRGLTFSTSLLSSIRVVSHFVRRDALYAIPMSDAKLKLYFLISAAAFAILSLYILFIEKAFWKKILLLTVSIIILPQIGFSYKLISLYLPLYLFINTDTFKRARGMNYIYLIFFGLLMVPKEFRSIAGESISVILNPLIMLTLVLLTITSTLLNNADE